VKQTTVGIAVASCAALVIAGVAGTPSAMAKNGDTHITAVGSTQTVDCNDSTLLINGGGNTITAVGSCWAVTTQGSNNMVIVDNVVNDITVYGFNQTVLFKPGDPFIIDRGRELGMVNRIDRIPS
jgi:hypothetical protein